MTAFEEPRSDSVTSDAEIRDAFDALTATLAPLAPPVPEVLPPPEAPEAPEVPSTQEVPIAAPPAPDAAVTAPVIVPMPTAPPPSTHPPEAAAKTPGHGRRTALFAVIALIVGAGIGFAVGLPGKNSVTSARDEAREQVVDLTGQLDGTKATLSSTQSDLTAMQEKFNTTTADLATATSELDATKADLAAATDKVAALDADLATANSDLQAMTDQRDVCQSAATAGKDLVDQWENYFDDLVTYFNTAYGSAAEAQIVAHMNEQEQKMLDQREEMRRLVSSCVAG